MSSPSHPVAVRFAPWLLATALVAGLAAQDTQDPAAAALQKQIAEHFTKAVAELSRSSRLTIYGETLSATRPKAETLRKEQELFTKVMATTAAKTLPAEVLMLGHNLVVFEPTLAAPTGTERPMTKAYLRALIAAAADGNEQQLSALFYAALAAGALGEQEMVAQLDSKSLAVRKALAQFLSYAAIHPASVAPIEKRIAVETDAMVRAMLVRSLALIGMPSSAKLLQELAAKAKDDEVQAAAIFAFVEVAGFDGIAFLNGLSPTGEHAKQSLGDGLQYLKAETSAASKHGREVGNDEEFVMRFGDLSSCPTIRWLGQIGRLDEAAVTKREKFTDEHKKKLLDLLADSKGFGLEAIKGSLFLSLAKGDEAALLRILAASFASPDAFTQGRMKTLGIMIRHCRQDL
jgi:hypothetical protein